MARRAPVQVFKVPSVIGPRWIGQCVMCGWARGSGRWDTAFRVAQEHAKTHAPAPRPATYLGRLMQAMTGEAVPRQGDYALAGPSKGGAA